MENWKKIGEELMEKNLEKLTKDLEKIRSNYVSLTVLEDLLIEFPTKKEILKKLASLRISPQKELVIRVFEPKNISFITKGIIAARLGYHLTKSESEEIYFSLMPLSEEGRQQLIKKVGELVEEGKVTLRNSRQKIRDSLKRAKKDKTLSESEEKAAEKIIEELTNKYLRQIEELKSKKVKSMKLN